MRPDRTGDCTVGTMTALVDPDAPSARPAHVLAALIASRALSPVEAVAQAVERAIEVQPALNCFTDIWVDEAMEAADEAERALSGDHPLGVLHGVPVAVKDTTPVAGHRTTFGSRAFEHWVPEHDAYIVGALRRAGAVIIGQTTTPEFAHTLRTDSPLWGVTRNPYDTSRSPGGSSGGSGAAVSSGCIPLAEGSDMGGSVRIPAAWSGVVGLKPGLGRIPMDVLPGLFDSISHHGPLARCADDARLFLAATQGPDDADIMSVPGPLDLAAPLDADLTGMRLGLSVDLGCWAVDPEIASAVTAAAERLEAAGARVEEVDPAFTGADEEAWGVLWGVFMATYYGHLLDEFADRHGPRGRRPRRSRQPPLGGRREAHRDPPHEPVAAPGADPRRARRPALPDDGQPAVAGSEGRRGRRPARGRRRLPLPRHDRRVQPRVAVPGGVGAVRPACRAQRTPASRSACRSSGGAGARTRSCAWPGRSR